MNLLSHVFTGLVLGEVLGLDLTFSILGSIIPDTDYLLGIEHRVIMHSLIFLLVIVIFFHKYKRQVTSFGVAYLSHVALDVLTVQGVKIVWPISQFYSYELFYSSDLIPNIAVLVIAAVLLLNRDIIRNKLEPVDPKMIRLATYLRLE